MEINVWIAIVLMVIIAGILTFRLIIDIRNLEEIRNINEFILENNLTENSCQAYCMLTRCLK